MSSSLILPLQTAGAESSTETRPQADPLPSKRGEIGFIEGVHDAAAIPHGNASEVDLPERHPADRGAISTSTSTSTPPVGVTDSIRPASSEDGVSTSSSTSITKRSHLLGFLTPRRTFGGVQLSTLIQFSVQLLLLGATGVVWFFVTKLLQHMASNGQSMPTGGSSSVFVHVLFVVVVVVQLVFLERRLFRLRGERYSYLHPGEVLPRHRRIPMTPEDTNIAFAPWNRPPLPTYAAALSQSGVGTGDVEDNLIAAAPPPAYGHTRGSTLLLRGYLRDSLRLQRPPSVHSQSSARRSYVSAFEQSEGVQDASDRVRQLENTLNRLEAQHASLDTESALR